MSTIEQFLLPVKFKTQEFTATAAQTIITLTTISIPGADSERVRLYINGRRQASSAYSVDSTTQLTTSEGMEAGDLIEVEVISRK